MGQKQIGFILGVTFGVLLMMFLNMVLPDTGAKAWQIEKVRVMKMIQELEAINDAELKEVQQKQEIIDSQLEQYEQKKSVDSQRQMI